MEGYQEETKIVHKETEKKRQKTVRMPDEVDVLIFERKSPLFNVFRFFKRKPSK